jgi:hypothetical protein
LALKLGMPVGEMLSRMSSAELTEWMAFFKLQNEPEKPKQKASNVLRAMFAHRVIRKKTEP